MEITKDNTIEKFMQIDNNQFVNTYEYLLYLDAKRTSSLDNPYNDVYICRDFVSAYKFAISDYGLDGRFNMADMKFINSESETLKSGIIWETIDDGIIFRLCITKLTKEEIEKLNQLKHCDNWYAYGEKVNMTISHLIMTIIDANIINISYPVFAKYHLKKNLDDEHLLRCIPVLNRNEIEYKSIIECLTQTCAPLIRYLDSPDNKNNLLDLEKKIIDGTEFIAKCVDYESNKLIELKFSFSSD